MAATAEVIDFNRAGNHSMAPVADYQPHTVDLVVRAFESHLPALALKQAARVIPESDCAVTAEAIPSERDRYGYYVLHVTAQTGQLKEAINDATELFLDVAGRYEDLGFMTLESATVDESVIPSTACNIAEIFMAARNRKLEQLFIERGYAPPQDGLSLL